MRNLLSEFLGTFALVFAGTGAIVINQASGGAITHPGIALTFGLVVLAMIYCFGDVSGAHLNPAVTTAFAAAGRFPWSAVPGYVLSQVAGAISASALLHLLFPLDPHLGATIPAGSAVQSLILEIVLTFFLMLVILSVSTGAKEKGITAGIAIGAVIALEAMFAGPICGASMNPARSLAPALVSGQMEPLWLYLVGPLLGALLAVPACCGVPQQARSTCRPGSGSCCGDRACGRCARCQRCSPWCCCWAAAGSA
jgi:aquaporin Z